MLEASEVCMARLDDDRTKAVEFLLRGRTRAVCFSWDIRLEESIHHLPRGHQTGQGIKKGIYKEDSKKKEIQKKE